MMIVGGCVMNGRSQQKRLDSLLAVRANHTREDSGKVMLLIDISREYRKLKMTKERFQYVQAAIDLGEKINVLRPLPPMYNYFGLYYEGRSDFEKSIIHYTRAIAIAESFGDKKAAAGYYLNFGTVYQLLADYPRSLALYQKAADYNIQTGNIDDLSNCYINMGGIYMEFSQQTEKALEFFAKALKIYQNMPGGGDRRGQAECYLSIGSAYVGASDSVLYRLRIQPKDKYTIARQYYAKALVLANELGDSAVKAEVSENIGRIEEKMINFPAAIYEYQNALSIYRAQALNKYVSQELLNLGRVYRAKNDFPYSLLYLHMALADAKQMKVLDLQSEAYLHLSGIYESQHNFDSSYFYYKQYIVTRDSIFNDEKKKDITRKQFQYEFGLKEYDYKLNQQMADTRIKQQEAFSIQQQQELSLSSKQLELTNREKEIQKLNYLKTQSELTAEQKLKTSMFQQKDLERKLETRSRDEKIADQQLQIGFDKKLTIFLAAMLLLLSGAGFIVYSSKQKASKLNKVVLAQKEELEEMGKVKDKIFSIVSHDMRAPVNNLIAFGSLLEGGQIDQQSLALYIDQIKGTLDHTSSLMENLLNWAASQMQGFTPVIEDIDIAPIIEHIIKGTETALLKKKIELQNQVTPATQVRGDRNMIELIIRNLVSNAIKFSGHEGELEIFTSMNTDNKLVLSVRDNGVGMSEQKVHHINGTSVHTLESTYGTAKEKGTGLGLMLCKHFASMMGGSITVKSKPGIGSLFNMALPAVA